MMTLYYSPGACSLASHIALEEAGVEHELVKIDLRAGEQRTPEYLAVNPKGSTPALKTDRGVLTENPVILGYIAQQTPDAGLAPKDDSYLFGKLQSFNMFLASSVHPAMGRALFGGLQGEAATQAKDAALTKLRLVEDKLFQGPWADGERFSIADGYLYVFARWAKQAGWLDGGDFPKLNDHLARVQERPAVRRTLEHEGLQPV